MKNFKQILALSSFFLSISALASSGPKPEQNPFELSSQLNFEKTAKERSVEPGVFLFSSNVASKLGPCGCSVNPKGGFDRRFNFLKSVEGNNKATVYLMDAGNALFASKRIDPSLASEQKLRAREVAKAQSDLGVVAHNVGALDLSAGVDFIKDVQKHSKLNFISSNLVDDESSKLLFKAYELIKIGEDQVLVLGLTNSYLPGVYKSLDYEETINKYISKTKPSFLIVLSDLGQAIDNSLMAKISIPNLFVGSRDLAALDIPFHVKKGLAIQPGIQGQQVARFSYLPGTKFKGWRNLTQDKLLSNRWKQLASEYKFVKDQKSSEDRSSALDKIKSSFEALSVYAETELKRAWLYEYELVDMDERYAQKNAFTQLAKKDR
jgi:hypothetical protein